MFYEFYIDQFTAEHLLSGYLLLLSAASAAGQKKSFRRLLTGDLVGVLTMLLLVCSGIRGWYFSGMLVAGLTVFGEKNLKRTVRHLILLILVTFCFSGFLHGIVQISGLTGAAAMSTAGVLMYHGIRWKKEKEYTEVICSVCLKWKDKSCRIQALLDTGNNLREPLTGRPVSILEQREAEKLLGNVWEQRKGFYLIPYHSLGTEKAWMKAVTVDRMQIEYAGKSVMVESPVIALYQGNIGKNCQMILHCEHVRVPEYSRKENPADNQEKES